MLKNEQKTLNNNLKIFLRKRCNFLLENVVNLNISGTKIYPKPLVTGYY